MIQDELAKAKAALTQAQEKSMKAHGEAADAHKQAAEVWDEREKARVIAVRGHQRTANGHGKAANAAKVVAKARKAAATATAKAAAAYQRAERMKRGKIDEAYSQAARMVTLAAGLATKAEKASKTYQKINQATWKMAQETKIASDAFSKVWAEAEKKSTIAKKATAVAEKADAELGKALDAYEQAQVAKQIS